MKGLWRSGKGQGEITQQISPWEKHTRPREINLLPIKLVWDNEK